MTKARNTQRARRALVFAALTGVLFTIALAAATAIAWRGQQQANAALATPTPQGPIVAFESGGVVVERFCLHDPEGGAGVMVVDLRPSDSGSTIYASFASHLRPDGAVLRATGLKLPGSDAETRFHDNWGAPASLRLQRFGDTVHVSLKRLGQPLYPGVDKARNYGDFVLDRRDCEVHDRARPDWAQTTETYDHWRYLPKSNQWFAAADLMYDLEPGAEPAFRLSCTPDRRRIEFLFFADSDDDPTQWSSAAYRNIDLILADDETEHTVSMPGEMTKTTVKGSLPLTADLAMAINLAPQIMLYAENGPTNRYMGGRAEAVRRLVRECAQGLGHEGAPNEW